MTAIDEIYDNPDSGRDILEQSDDYQITAITVRTHEPVTPGWLAYRMAQACGGAALREGESISVDGLEFTVGQVEPFTWPGTP